MPLGDKKIYMVNVEFAKIIQTDAFIYKVVHL